MYLDSLNAVFSRGLLQVLGWLGWMSNLGARRHSFPGLCPLMALEAVGCTFRLKIRDYLPKHTKRRDSCAFLPLTMVCPQAHTEAPTFSGLMLQCCRILRTDVELMPSQGDVHIPAAAVAAAANAAAAAQDSRRKILCCGPSFHDAHTNLS